MGYTHYWYYGDRDGKRQQARNEKWPVLQEYAEALFEHGAKQYGIELAYFKGEPGTHPLASEDLISFNGVDKTRDHFRGDDESHEAFFFERVPDYRIFETYTVTDLRGKETTHGGDGFAFCKTARKPYDPIVCALLLVIDGLGMVKSISSDGRPTLPGEEREWEDAGWNMAQQMLRDIGYKPALKKVLVENRKGRMVWTSLATAKEMLVLEL